MKVADKRTRQMSELLNNIKSIKLYNWEGFFMSRILAIRNDQELKLLRKYGIMTVCRITRFSDNRNSRWLSVNFNCDLAINLSICLIRFLRRCRVYLPEASHF